MKHILRRPALRLSLIIIIALCAGFSRSAAQCPNTNTIAPFNPDLTPAGPGLSDSVTCAWSQDYYYFSCVAGQTYVISACASINANDPIFTLYNHTSGAYITFNDNFCGNYPQITWVATYTGQARLVVDEGGPGCIHSSLCIHVKVTWLDPCSGSPPSVNITPSTPIACNGGTGAIAANITGGFANYNYAWSTGASTLNTASTTDILSGLSAGTYTVTVADNNSCTATATYTLTQPSAVSASISSQNNVACKGASTGNITAAGSGGTGGYSYLWSNGANTATATGLAAGTYTVTITDANSCTATTSGTITEPATALGASISAQTNVSCNGGNNGSLTGTGSGGAGSYTFLWSTGDATATASNLSAGFYTLTITDINGCTATTSATITQPSALSASAVVDSTVSCNGGSDGGMTAVPTGGTSGYLYSWSNAATTASITGVAAGTYTVTITDANGCTAVANNTVTEPSALVASVVVDSTVSCNGGSNGGMTGIPTGGTAGYLYSWSNGATTAFITGVSAGTYSVTITDANGCTATDNNTVTEPSVLSVSASVDSTVSCNGYADGGLTASPTGGVPNYNYLWSNAATNAGITGVTAGTYTVTVTDANGCTATGSAIVTQPSVLSVSINEDASPTCVLATGQLTATPSGGTSGYAYIWSNGNTNAVNSGLPAGTYTVTVTDANGCTATNSHTLNSTAAPTATVTSQTNVLCNGGSSGSINITPSGGTPSYTYQWSNGATTEDISSLAAGTYTCTVTDANGCTTTTGSTITQPSALGASVTAQTNVLCNGDATGSLTAAGSGGTSGYTYLWSNGANTATASGLASGTYTCTVTDANSCTTTTSGTITQPASTVSASISAQTNVLCNGSATGSLTAAGSGGTSGYTYLWSNGANTATASGLASGTYTCTVTDANGCTTTTSSTVTQPATALSASVSAQTNVLCNGDATGSLTAAGSGGTSGYTFLWSNGANTATASSLASGTYTCTVTDANGCTTTTSSTVTQPSPLGASVTAQTNVLCNGDATGSLTAAGNGGTSGYTYLWSNGANTATASGLASGTYTCTVTDANSCTTTTSGTITQPASAVSASITGQTNVLCNGSATGSLTAAGSGGTSGYTYLWSNGANTATATGLAAGTYTVTVTDANSCTTTTSSTVTQPATAVSASVTVDSDAMCGANNGQLTAAGSGGTSGYTYLWSNGGTTATISGLAAGTYSVTVTDANSCTTTSSGTVNSTGSVTASISAQTNVSCNGGSSGSLTAAGSGGSGGYSYAWSNGANTATAGSLAAGTYTVTVTDGSGCTGTQSAIVTQPTALGGSISSSAISCNGGNDGSLTAAGSGGTSGYTYLWSNGANTATAGSLTAGTYTVTITDANSCTFTTSSALSDPTLLMVSTAVDSNVSCNGFADGGLTAAGTGGTGGYSYLWSNGATTTSVTGLAAGTYTVTVTDGNGCTATGSSPVTEPAALTVAVSVDSTADCGGLGGFTAAATGGTSGYGYSWNTGAMTASVTGLTAGTYTVLVTDANGCIAFQNGTMTGSPSPNVSLAPITAPLCENGTAVSLSGSPAGGTYSGTGVSGNSFDPMAAGLGSHMLYYSYTDSTGCTAMDSQMVTVNSAPTAVIMPPGDFCTTDIPTILNAVPAGGTFSGVGMNGSFFDPSLAGAGTHTISYTYTNAQGCSDTDQMDITVVAVPTIAFDPVPDPVCLEEGIVDLTATPGGGSWSGPGITGNSFDPSVTGTGSFTVYYTVSNSVCMTMDSLALTVDICTGVQEGLFEAVRVYPNPNRGAFRVEGLPTGAEVRMRNSLGQAVYGRNADGDSMDIQVQLPAGIYYLEIRKADQVLRKRIILQ